jgi:hypothetical protein
LRTGWRLGIVRTEAGVTWGFTMFKRMLIVVAAVAAALPGVGASAGPPESFEVPDFFQLFLDEDEGKSTWINITALDFCLWALGDFEGPAPVVDDAVPATLNFTAKGGEAAVASVKTDALYIEIWNLDNPDGPFVGPCEDILDQLLAGSGPWATGTTSLNIRTNNLFDPPAEPRAVSGGFSGTALVDAGEDTYRYQFTSHSNDSCRDFVCAVTNTSLRRI